MDITDLRHFALGILRFVEDEQDVLAPHFGGIHAVKKLIKHLDRTTKELARLEDIFNEERQDSSHDSLKRNIKANLNRLEFLLFEELKGFVFFGGKLLQNPGNVKRDFKDEVKSITEALSELVTRSLSFRQLEMKPSFNRNKDMEAVRHMLLKFDDHVSVIPIVGMSGIGKTTLVRELYNDTSVNFSLKHWVCMSEIIKPRQILEKILGLGTPDDDGHDLLAPFHTLVDGKRYLLVLDGMTQADLGVYINGMLRYVGRGSRVIVTTSNTEVPNSLAPLPLALGAPYELGCLDEADSYALFEHVMSPPLMDIGVKILEKCGNIPRVIKTVASLLHSKYSWHEWEHFFNIVLGSVTNPTEKIRLELNPVSYKQLPPTIKQRLTYCSLFPMDHEFYVTDMVHLWDAQAFFKASGSECFRTLQHHGYFIEDGKKDSNGAVVSYKMQYLAYELVKYMAIDYDCHLIDNHPYQMIDERFVRHMSFIVNSSMKRPYLYGAKNLRSLLFLRSKSCNEYIDIPEIIEVLSKLRALRTLDLAPVNCESLQNFIGELKYLRYLRLGKSSRSLPMSIAELQNLQTLDLRQSNVRYLPPNFSDMYSLSHLYTGDTLIDLPPRFGNLKSLQTLDVFIVGENNGLGELARLGGFGAAGKLKIRFNEGFWKHTLEALEGILEDRNLAELLLVWSSWEGEQIAYFVPEKDDMVLECLQPPTILESLTVHYWRGMTFPLWGMDEITVTLPHLTSVDIVGCSNCKQLPAFSSLPSLRSLKLQGLSALKYIEDGDNSKPSSATTTYFPSLEYLMLLNLPELEGWSNNGTNQQRHADYDYISKPNFSCLSLLRVSRCPKLMLMPPAQNLEALEADNINAKLLNHILHAYNSLASPTTSSASFRLKKLQITCIHELDSFSTGCSSLEYIMIRRCQQLIILVAGSATSLKRLEIHECGKLKDICNALQHLSALEVLEINRCDELGWGDRAAWQGLKSIRSLKMSNMLKLKSIPDGFDCITTLEELSLCWLSNLKDLPESIGNLTQLRKLAIRYCPSLIALPEALHHLSNLQQLEIKHCPRVINFITELPDSLQRLQIRECGRLKDISRGLQSLSNLEELEIERCEDLDWGDAGHVVQVDVDVSSERGTPWQGLKSLRSLNLTSISNLKMLPGSLGYLTMLQELSLCSLYNLKSLPEWIVRLTQLRRLSIKCCPHLSELPTSLCCFSALEHFDIGECPGLERKCRRGGEYWPLIHHIKSVTFNFTEYL